MGHFLTAEWADKDYCGNGADGSNLHQQSKTAEYVNDGIRSPTNGISGPDGDAAAGLTVCTQQPAMTSHQP